MATSKEVTNENTITADDLAEWTESTSVMGKVKITIYKKEKFGCITGGDFGPGKANLQTEGISFNWNLPIANICTGTDQTLVLRTLLNCMDAIGSAAQTSCQSYSLVCSGDYDGKIIGIGGMANTGGSTPTEGQLQIHGIGIDLSDVDDPDFADLSKLPIGVYLAQPVPGVTKRVLGLVIKE